MDVEGRVAPGAATERPRVMHDSKDLGTPLWGVEEVETRQEQRSRSNYRAKAENTENLKQVQNYYCHSGEGQNPVI